MTRLRPHLLIAACGLFAGNAVAAVQTLQSIQHAATEFVREHLPQTGSKHYLSAAKLDPRLRLDACSSPLQTFSQSALANDSRVTVGVRCAAPSPWTLYVTVTVEVEAPVLVLRRALARDTRVQPADVEAQVRRLPGSAAKFISSVAALKGHHLKRSLPVGTALTVDMLSPDVLVHRGQQVTLVAASGPVEIRAQGRALSEGGAADRVRVQNLTSLKVVEGVVENANVVRVGL